MPSYNAKKHPHLPKLKTLLSKLSLRPKIVIINNDPKVTYSGDWESDWIGWQTFLDHGKVSKLGRTPQGEIEWSRQSFGNFSDIIQLLKVDVEVSIDWPLWILFSSGTTGMHRNYSANGR